MRVAFFTVFRSDPQHYLHAAALVQDCRAIGARTLQLTDETTPSVPGVDAVNRLPHGRMLERRIEHYASVEGDVLFLDTDVSLRQDVRGVFEAPFDVALTDRHWPHLPQAADVLATMPFNTGVAFSRCPAFWRDVLAVWNGYTKEQQDWMSEQRAVYEVVKTGRYRVKVLDGAIYNYPPTSAEDHGGAAIVHYKGPHRKAWLSDRAYQVLGQSARSEVAA